MKFLPLNWMAALQEKERVTALQFPPTFSSSSAEVRAERAFMLNWMAALPEEERAVAPTSSSAERAKCPTGAYNRTLKQVVHITETLKQGVAATGHRHKLDEPNTSQIRCEHLLMMALNQLHQFQEKRALKWVNQLLRPQEERARY